MAKSSSRSRSSRRKTAKSTIRKVRKSRKSRKSGSRKSRKSGSKRKVSGWIKAVSQARKELNITGFYAIKKGTPLYKRAKEIYGK